MEMIGEKWANQPLSLILLADGDDAAPRGDGGEVAHLKQALGPAGSGYIRADMDIIAYLSGHCAVEPFVDCNVVTDAEVLRPDDFDVPVYAHVITAGLQSL